MQVLKHWLVLLFFVTSPEEASRGGRVTLHQVFNAFKSWNAIHPYKLQKISWEWLVHNPKKWLLCLWREMGHAYYVEVFRQSHGKGWGEYWMCLSGMGSKSYVQTPVRLLHPLRTRIRKHFIFKVGWGEVILAVTRLLNPGELAAVCEVTHNAVGTWLQNMETNLKKFALPEGSSRERTWRSALQR